MKKIPAASTLCLIALVAAPLLAFAIESTDTVTSETPAVSTAPVTTNRKPISVSDGTNKPNIKTGCRELWYKDNSTPTCQKKTFCGAFMYQGLVTFPSEESCKAVSSVVKKPAIGGNPDGELSKLNQASVAAKLKDNIAQFKTLIAENKTEAIQRFKNKRDDLKARIREIKDEKKKALAERIDAKITRINANRTEQMTKYIERMKELLGKIQAKSDEAKNAGKNTTTVEAAIKAAQAALDKSAAAVATQAGKQYVATITSEATLKNNFGSVARQLEADLKTVRQTLIDAQKAVANTAKVLGQVRGIESSTPSAEQNE